MKQPTKQHLPQAPHPLRVPVAPAVPALDALLPDETALVDPVADQVDLADAAAPAALAAARVDLADAAALVADATANLVAETMTAQSPNGSQRLVLAAWSRSPKLRP